MSDDAKFADIPLQRRVFLRRMVTGAAVAVPVVTSFQLSGMLPAAAQTPNVSGATTPEPTPTTATTTSTTTTTTTTTTSTTTTSAPQ